MHRFWFAGTTRQSCDSVVQGFKVVIRDIGLHMSNRVMDYCNEDVGLCRGALEARRGPPVVPVKTDFSSVQEFLESSHFVQVSQKYYTGPRNAA